jgi:hypothetical protein
MLELLSNDDKFTKSTKKHLDLFSQDGLRTLVLTKKVTYPGRYQQFRNCPNKNLKVSIPKQRKQRQRWKNVKKHWKNCMKR